MANRPASIRKADLQRTIKGVMELGLPIVRVEVEGGRIVIFTAEKRDDSALESWRRQKNGSR